VIKTKLGEDLETGGFIKNILQPFYGPSFHVISPEVSVKDVPKAQVMVVLPTTAKLSVNVTNKRVARFGLTVTSQPSEDPANYSQVEVGVEYDGAVWATYFRTSIIRGLGLRTMPVMYGGKGSKL
jgi:hypothetical protein